jgi:putative ABC transport system permease protein
MRLIALAFRNVARNRRRTAMAVFAVGIGVASLIALRSFISGQQEVFLQGLVHGHLGAIQIHRQGYLDSLDRLPLTLDMPDDQALRSKLLSVRGVTGAAGRILFGAMLSTPGGEELTEGKTAFLMLTAIEPRAEQVVCPQRFHWIGRGKVFRSSSDRELWLNSDLAASVGVPWTQDPVHSPEREWPALLASDRDGTLNGEAVAMTATLLSTLPGDRKVGYVPLEVAQRLLRMEGRVTEYALAVQSLDQIPRIREELQTLLGTTYEVHAWYELVPWLKGLFSNMELTFAITTGLLLLVMLSGILNAMLTNVFERQREIGTLMAFGTRRTQVVLLFMIEGAAMGVLGGIVGVLLGSSAVLSLHSRGITLPIPGSDIPAVVIPELHLSILVISFLLAALGSAAASLWPAFRASRMRPIEALSAR